MKAVVKLLSTPSGSHSKVICFLPDILEGLTVVEARAGDWEIVLRILNEAAEWLRSKEIDQWQSAYWTRTLISDGIRNGEVYLARLEGEVVGTITLQWSDPRFWGDTLIDAAYFHRLAIKREYAAKGLGRVLVEWAVNRAKAAGESFLRLNCSFENQRLRRYYEDAGFSYRGEARVRDLRFALYEKQL